MDVTTTQTIEHLLLPPGGPILLGFIGLIFWRFGFGRKLFVFALLCQWLLSLPVTADLLMQGLERYPALTASAIETSEAEAIVVLGGGRYRNAPEYGGDTLNERSLSRLRYSAKLSRETGLPVIPSGGAPTYAGTPEARIAAGILRNEFSVTVDYIESRSRTTWENARYTAQLLKKQSIKKILLVTDAGHMQRSLYAFERNGIKATPAPTAFVHVAESDASWPAVLPQPRAAYDSAYAMHEYIGLLWYRLKVN